MHKMHKGKEKRIHILIAEDSPTQVEQLRHILEEEGYQVTVVCSGLEALEAVARQRPTLVISDIMMPKMDGYQLCSRIKADEALQDIPVILLTTLSETVDVLRGLECGADHFLTKPFEERHLLSCLSIVLANRHLYRHEGARMGIEIFLGEKKYFITSDRLQILNLLLSTYDTAVQKNNELRQTQEKLRTLNERLEELVQERTAALKAETEEHKRTADQLRQAQKMEAVGQLAGGVAHDFNNLLTVIMGYADILSLELGLESKYAAGIQEIRDASERAAALTLQLLAFSRRQVLQPRLLDLNTVVRGMEKMLPRLIGEDIELKTVYAPALGLVKADWGQLEQVIMNLTVNARDAMPQGGKLVIETANVALDEEYARTHPGAQPGSFIMLSVSDTGCGMDEATQARIFQPFFTTKEPGKGTGLGLSTVYGIVKQSDGYIWVDTEPGKGATFKIYLTQVKTEDRPSQAASEAVETLDGTETLLIIEDEDGVRHMARMILESQGYTVLEAKNGKEALEIVERHNAPIHLVVADVVMPQMSGPETIKRLHKVHPGLKVLYMSGYMNQTIDCHGVLDVGAVLLQKPFTRVTLSCKVREVLDRQ